MHVKCVSPGAVSPAMLDTLILPPANDNRKAVQADDGRKAVQDRDEFLGSLSYPGRTESGPKWLIRLVELMIAAFIIRVQRQAEKRVAAADFPCSCHHA